MNDENQKQVKNLLDSLDELCAALHEITRSKQAIIKSLVVSGMRESAAINDFCNTVQNLTGAIDATVKEIRRIIS